jgi:hypothetical protein
VNGWMPSPFRFFRHAMLGSLSLDVRQRLQVETKGFVDLARGAWIARLSVAYKPCDGQRYWLGADLIEGVENSPLRYLSGADRVLGGIELTTH